MKSEKQKKSSGQALILTILAIGGVMMGATAIAGLLMLYQIQETNDSAKSAQAVFAADAGLNWALFDYFCNVTTSENPMSRCINIPPSEQPFPGGSGSLVDDAVVSTTCYDATNSVAQCSDTTNAFYAVSLGTSLTSRRAFSLTFGGEAITP